ncbi:MAG: nucleotide exchange factor GrpE [Bacteroidetes bacterium 4484_249]|nr:MAG: nucleotide exchange factor GrpE [Bacteroidetes bacterium 4484_249]
MKRKTEKTKENLEKNMAKKTTEERKTKAGKKQTKKSIPKAVGTKEKELQEKADELNDKYLRLYSEFDNYRKRTIKEKLDLNRTASEGVISELLPVLDDFERAIESTADSKDCEAVKEGVKLIYNKFKAIMEKKGLKPILAIGEEFDTDFHEAITYIPAPSKDLKGKIVDEIEKGYLLSDKVIRFSKVVIGN